LPWLRGIAWVGIIDAANINLETAQFKAEARKPIHFLPRIGADKGNIADEAAHVKAAFMGKLQITLRGGAIARLADVAEHIIGLTNGGAGDRKATAQINLSQRRG